MLEQNLYDARLAKRNLIIYQIGDLENLSASALYTDKLPKFSAGGAAFDLPKPIGSLSGFGNTFDVGTGYVYDSLKMDGFDLLLRLRADADNKIGPHFNDEIIYSKKERSKPILTNNHFPFDWNK